MGDTQMTGRAVDARLLARIEAILGPAAERDAGVAWRLDELRRALRSGQVTSQDRAAMVEMVNQHLAERLVERDPVEKALRFWEHVGYDPQDPAATRLYDPAQPRDSHGRWTPEGGPHDEHGAGGGHRQRQHEAAGGALHAHAGMAHAAAHHDTAGGGGSGHGRHSRPFSDHDFATAFQTMQTLPAEQQGFLHPGSGIVQMGGREYHVKAFTPGPRSEYALRAELAARGVAEAVGHGETIARAWHVQHNGTDYLVSERVPGEALRAIALRAYPGPGHGQPDIHRDERAQLEHDLLQHIPDRTRGMIWVHEYVTNNGDTHDGNLMIHSPSGTLHSIDHERSFESPSVSVSHFSATAHYSMWGHPEGAKGLKLPRDVMETYVRHAGDLVRVLDDHDLDPGGVIARLQVLDGVLRHVPTDREITIADVDAEARAYFRRSQRRD